MAPGSADTAVQVADHESGTRLVPPPGQHRQKLKNFLPRVLSALVLAPIALGAAYVGGWAFALLVTFASGFALIEWLRLTEHSDGATTVLGIGGLIGSASAALFGQFEYAIFFAAPFALLVSVISRLKIGRGIWAATGFLYLDIPVLSLIFLRETQGYELVFWMLGVIWAMDIGAYIFGSIVGGPKLAPRLSPNKTWSGLIGGVLCATLISALLSTWLNLDMLRYLTWGAAILAIWSQVGDVFESSIKRRFNVKDSGGVIPGHGGVLDRIDSLAFAAPIVAVAAWALQAL